MLKLAECEESVTHGSATFTRTKALPVFFFLAHSVASRMLFCVGLLAIDRDSYVY